MSYGNQVAPRRSVMTTAGKWMFIIGLVLSILAAIALIWGIRSIVDYASTVENESTQMAGGTATVQMETGQTRMIVAEGGAAPTCTVSLPDGSQTQLPGGIQDMEDTVAQTGWQLVGSYTASTSGEHTFSCEGAAQTSLTPPFSATTLAAAGVGGLALLALLPLGLLTIVGLILWLVGRSRDRTRQAQVGPGGPGDPYGYQGYQQGYGQPGSYPPPGQGYGDPGSYPQQGQGYSQPGEYPPQDDSPRQGQGWSQPGGYGAPPPAGSPDHDQPRDEDRR